MANDSAVSFKASLIGVPNSEVRRFVVDHQTVTSFQSLELKLRQVFPTLNSKSFNITWKDSDGDFVMISSDDELIIALTEMNSDPRRLYINITGKSSPSGKVQGDLSVHDGVVCDSCDGAVSGYRYKCAQCPDYDLCATCEGHGNHPEHVMMRIPFPLATNPMFSKRMSHHLEKTISRCAEKLEKCGRSDEKCGKGEEKCTSPRRGRRHGHFRNRGILDAVNSVINDYANLADFDPSSNNHGEHASKKRASGCPFATAFGGNVSTSTPEQAEGGAAAAPAANTEEATNATPNMTPNDSHVNYLRNIGQTIANILDPLGIDVDIDVRQKQGSDQQNQASNTDNAPAQNMSPKAEESAEPTSTSTPSAEPSSFQTFTPVFNASASNDQPNRPHVSFASISGRMTASPEPNTENGWTLVDDDSTMHVDVDVTVDGVHSTATSFSTSATTNSAPKEEPKVNVNTTTSDGKNTTTNETKTDAGATSNKGNGTPQAGAFPFALPLLPGFPFPMPNAPHSGFVPPQLPAGINFDQMARELHRHLQSQFSTAAKTAASATGDATNAATNAANVAASTAANIAAGAATAATNAFASMYPNLNHMDSTATFARHVVEPNIQVNTSQRTNTTTTNSTTERPVPTPASGNQEPQRNSTSDNAKPSYSPAGAAAVTRQTVSSVRPPIVIPSDRIRVPTAPTLAVHPDPRIAQALNTMLGMGFNNEGGWLATVLEQTGGDVSKAVDLLQPVGKK